MFYATGRTDEMAVWLAWVYVALRFLHSFIHLTYNNVLHRLSAFAVSNFVLIGMWAAFFMKDA